MNSRKHTIKTASEYRTPTFREDSGGMSVEFDQVCDKIL